MHGSAPGMRATGETEIWDPTATGVKHLVAGAGAALASRLLSMDHDPSSPPLRPSLDPEGEPAPVSRGVWLRFALLLGLFAGMIVFAQVSDIPDQISAARIRAALRSYGLWAPAVLLAVYAIRPVFLFPVSPLWVASGAFFGWVEGAILAIVGTALGAAAGFHLARHLGRAFVERRLGRVRRWSGMTAGRGFRTVLALQLTPIVPHDLINNLAGISRMPYRHFALASLLGTIPIIAVYAYLGYAVWEVPSPSFWIAVGVLTALTLAMLMWNRRLSRRDRAAAMTATSEEGGRA